MIRFNLIACVCGKEGERGHVCLLTNTRVFVLTGLHALLLWSDSDTDWRPAVPETAAGL